MTWQTAATFAVIGLFVVLVLAYEIGRAMVRKDPTSALGARLVLIGIGLRAVRRSPLAVYLPPPARMILDSISESDRPGPAGDVS